MKICTKCIVEKDELEFLKKKDKLLSWCKECNKIYMKEYNLKNKESLSLKKNEYYNNNSEIAKTRSKKWRIENPERHKEYFKEYYIENKSELAEYKKEYYEENKESLSKEYKLYREENKEKISEYLKNWREENKEYGKEYWINNKEKKKEYEKSYREKYPHIIAWRKSLRTALYRMDRKKNNSTIELLGYSSEDFKSHMESLFKEGMSWKNWGEWHVDHIFPLSKFDNKTPINIVNALNNLQPLWASENLSKKNKIQ